MRIRKLAKELETTPQAVIGLLHRLGQVRYDDPEQQLPDGVVAVVRRHGRDLRAFTPPPPPAPRARKAAPDIPPEWLTEAGVEAPDPVEERKAFDKAMSGVRPMGAAGEKRTAPKAARSAPAPVARPVAPLASPGPVPTIAARPAPPKGAVAAKAPPAPKVVLPPDPLAEALARAAAAEADLEAFRGRAEAAEIEKVVLCERIDALERDLADVEGHRRSLQRQLAERGKEPVTLKELFERRGLMGDDEVALALRALLDAHRERELVAQLRVADAEGVEAFLWDRLLLLAEGEDAPAGVVPVRVPAERSEGGQSSANRAAMNRFSTACLVHNKRRIVLVGGSPAYHRVLKDGVDPRIDLRLIPGTRRGRIPEIQDADHVFVWASTILDHRVSERFPEATVLPHRGIARMLGAATEHVEGRVKR